MTASPAPQPPTPQPPQRVSLPTWVNVVLVLILLASCGAANTIDDLPLSGEVADNVVSRLQDTDTGTPTEDARDLCLLLGAVLDGQGKPVADVFAGEPEGSQCREAAEQGAAR